MSCRFSLCFLILCLRGEILTRGVEGLACNWGTRPTHPLPADIVVKLLKENEFNKVKLFEPDAPALKALGNSGVQVMLGLPNDLLASLADSAIVADQWVKRNVSFYISKYRTDIRYVAVGNEPFLKDYKNKFVQTTFPAMKNIQAALLRASLGKKVKVTVPINGDVYQTDSGLPSGGDFRPDIRDQMMSILKLLKNNAAPLTINIYPFLSLAADPNFPFEYAFFNGSAKPLVDGSIKYNNSLEANFDTLIAALENNGFGKMPVVIVEVGWPTDGETNANIQNAKRFNQGLMDRIIQGKGTPKRSTPPEIYVFSLIDEDAKSTDPGKFERHWGIFNYDGSIKYQMNMGKGKKLIPARGVHYLDRQWCVVSPQASIDDPSLQQSISYACSYADCTSLGNGSSCGNLDPKNYASYAFNMYYQAMDQRKGACNFSNLSVITRINPSQGSCRFNVMIDLGKHEKPKVSFACREHSSLGALFLVLMLILCGIH